MRAKRAEHFPDLHLSVDLEPARVLDAVDYLARHAPRYGIQADLELRRNRSGWAYDRHLLVCSSRSSGKPLWVMRLVLAPDIERRTSVALAVQAVRRFAPGREAGRTAEAYRQLLATALGLAAAPRDRHRDNVIPLRPYADLPSVASA